MTDLEIKTIAASRLSVIIEEKALMILSASSHEVAILRMLLIDSIEQLKTELIKEEETKPLPY